MGLLPVCVCTNVKKTLTFSWTHSIVEMPFPLKTFCTKLFVFKIKSTWGDNDAWQHSWLLPVLCSKLHFKTVAKGFVQTRLSKISTGLRTSINWYLHYFARWLDKNILHEAPHISDQQRGKALTFACPHWLRPCHNFLKYLGFKLGEPNYFRLLTYINFFQMP